MMRLSAPYFASSLVSETACSSDPPGVEFFRKLPGGHSIFSGLRSQGSLELLLSHFPGSGSGAHRSGHLVLEGMRQQNLS